MTVGTMGIFAQYSIHLRKYVYSKSQHIVIAEVPDGESFCQTGGMASLSSSLTGRMTALEKYCSFFGVRRVHPR